MSTGLKANPDGSAAIQVGGTDVITLTSGGAATFVTSPTTVQAGTAAAPSITFSGDTNTGIYSPGADQVAIATGGSQRTVVDASGNLLVGGTSSVYTNAGRGVIEANGSSQALLGLTIAGNSRGYLYHDGTNLLLQQVINGALLFATNNAERARIDSSGNLLVGTTSGSGYRMEVTTSGVTTMKVSRTGLSGANSVVDWFYNTTNVGSVAVSSTATSYNTSSDYRLKNSVAPMTGALAKVAALKPCTYKWNADDSDGEGFIAHELAEVVPNAVTGEKDAVNEDGTPKYQGIDTSFLVATLTAAIQEQQAIITQLQADVAALKGNA